MAVVKKCAHCSVELNNKDVVKKNKTKVYHIKCYKEMIANKYEKNSVEMEDKNILYDYINMLYKTSELDPKIKAQVDKYHLEYELSYTRMMLTLRYFYEIKNNKVEDKYGIGIIPHVYKEAEAFWIGKNTAISSNKGKDVKGSVSKKIIITRKKEEEKPFLIDIDNI